MMPTLELRQEQIGHVLAEVERVWRRNPHRTLAHLIRKASAGSGGFDPADSSDEHLLGMLQMIGLSKQTPV
jgi:uncharacterized protein YihD (DUF1040 family)